MEPILFVDRKPERTTSESKAQIQTLLDELASVEGDDLQSLANGAVDRFPLNVQDMYRKPASERTTYEHQIAYLVARQVIDEGLTDSKVTAALGKDVLEEHLDCPNRSG